MSDRAPMPAEKLVALADAHLVGELTPDELAELELELKESSASRALFALVTDQAAMMHEVFSSKETADLEIEMPETSEFLEVLKSLDDHSQDAQVVDLTQELDRRRLTALEKERAKQRALSLRNAKPEPSGPRVIIIPKLVAVLGVAAAMALMVTGVMAFLPNKPVNNTPGLTQEAPRTPTLQQAPAPVVATLVRSLDARWLDDAGAWDGADGLREGEHHLAEGLVEIELAKGARVVLEAPVSFTLNHTNAMTLAHGRLVATVPPAAVGFTVDTPSAQIIDYGTEFGVDVMADGGTQAHVFSGEITAAALQGTAPPSRLLQGQAGAVSPQGQMEPLDSQPLAFVREEEFSARYHAEESGYHRWLAYRYELLRDPGVVIYYAFEDIDLAEGTVFNTASGNTADAALVASGVAPGRFSEKPTVRFAHDDDHLAATLNRAMDAVTLAGWFWIDEMDGDFASLLHTDAVDAGGIHWHLNNNPQHGAGWSVEFVQNRQRDAQPGYWYDALSSGWSPRSLSGRWVHLAACYDTVSGEARLYVDGGEVAVEAVTDGVPVRLSDFRLGNWSASADLRGDGWPRALRGRIDEFVVLDRALEGREITAMFEAGRPED